MFNRPKHIQEITFDNKTKLTIHDVEKLAVGNWTHIVVKGKEYIINNDRVLFVKVYKKNKTDYEK